MTRNELNNPFFPPEVNLEVAIGAVEFRDKTIENLRQQIKVLRQIACSVMHENLVDQLQFEHIRNSKANNYD
jgi:regulator of replication initiation timing